VASLNQVTLPFTLNISAIPNLCRLTFTQEKRQIEKLSSRLPTSPCICQNNLIDFSQSQYIEGVFQKDFFFPLFVLFKSDLAFTLLRANYQQHTQKRLPSRLPQSLVFLDGMGGGKRKLQVTFSRVSFLWTTRALSVSV